MATTSSKAKKRRVVRKGRNKDRGRKTANPDEITSHHMIPRSRIPGVARNHPGAKGNIKRVRHCFHEVWHQLFINMIPYEVVVCLIERLAPIKYFSRIEIVASWRGRLYQYSLTSPRGPLPIVDHYRLRRNRTSIRRVRWLFGDLDWINIIGVIVTSWSPAGHFQKVLVESEKGGKRISFSFQRTEKRE